MKEDAPHLEPASSAEWRDWLAEHLGRPDGVWVVFQKKRTDRAGAASNLQEHAAGGAPERVRCAPVAPQQAGRLLTYEQAVEDALCFGWIDSTAGKAGEGRFKVWFAPRKPKSEWSRINKARVDWLIRDERMRPAGLAKIEEAKRNGAWSLLDAAEALDEPADFAAAFDANPAARHNYDGSPPGSRKIILAWIVRAVRPETRAKRIAEAVEKAARGIRANQARP